MYMYNSRNYQFPLRVNDRGVLFWFLFLPLIPLSLRLTFTCFLLLKNPMYYSILYIAIRDAIISSKLLQFSYRNIGNQNCSNNASCGISLLNGYDKKPERTRKKWVKVFASNKWKWKHATSNFYVCIAY